MRALPLLPIGVLIAALSLGACATTQRIDAAADVHNFLASVRDDDKAAFERYVDRRALTSSLELRIETEAARSEASPQLKLAAAALAGPAAKLLQQTLIRPSVFRLVAAQLGYTPDRPLPRTLDIAGGLRYVDDGRVCAAKGKKGPCLLTFAREGDTWRLVSIDAPVKDLKL
jgi:hypothetical protein